LRALGDGLLWDWVLCGLADCFGDLIAFESQGMGQDHLDGRAYVEKEVMRRPEEQKPDSESDASTDCCADHGIFSLVRRNGYARGNASERARNATLRNAAGEGRALRAGDGVTNQRSQACASQRRDEQSCGPLPGSLIA
jgi:hypothetical protein